MTVALLPFEFLPCFISHTSMAAILSTPGSAGSTVSHSTCPFCHRSGVRRLGNHLPCCPERNGRDYFDFLSDKTKANKMRPNSCKSILCPRYHKKFSRLDTHLRNSASCRDVSAAEPGPSAPLLVTSVGNSTTCPPPAAGPLLQSATQSLHPSCGPRQCPSPQTATAPEYTPKPKLRLPKSGDDWKKANVLFETDLVPRVLSESSVDSKYTVLAEGVYTYFETVYGSVKVRRRHRNRQSKR